MFDAAALAAARAHAMREFPKESCGVITADGYVPLQNVSAEPTEMFDCVQQLAPYLIAGTALALVHSHTNGKARPSAYDISQQFVMMIPWGIVVTNGEVALEPYFFGDQVPMPPLLGRQFRFGPSGTDGKGDCGAFIRDWYRANRGITLKDFPRPDYLTDEDLKVRGTLYLDYLVAAGFVPSDRNNPQPGDVALMRTSHRGPLNHTAILVGPGMIGHHFEDRLSREEPSINWVKLVGEWLRYAPA